MISGGLNRRSFLTAAAGATCAAGLPVTGAKGEASAFEVGSIKVLAFDFQGSCVDFHTPLMAAGRRINAEKGLNLDWGAFVKEWRELYNDIMEPAVAHRRDYITVDRAYRESLDTLLDRHGLSGKFTTAERDALNNTWSQMVAWPDTREGLRRLRKKFVLTTLSNAAMKAVFQMVHRNQLPFDEVLTGELVHNYKPAPEVYGLVLSMLGYEKDEVIYCASHFHDLKSAKAFGYKTAWWPRPNEDGPDTIGDTASKSFVDLSVTDIIGLAASLGT